MTAASLRKGLQKYTQIYMIVVFSKRPSLTYLHIYLVLKQYHSDDEAYGDNDDDDDLSNIIAMMKMVITMMMMMMKNRNENENDHSRYN